MPNIVEEIGPRRGLDAIGILSTYKSPIPFEEEKIRAGLFSNHEEIIP
jgi:hypothetical protein